MSNRRAKWCVLFTAAIILVGASVGFAADTAKSSLPFGSPDTIVSLRVKSINAGLDAIVQIVSVFQPTAAPMMRQQIEGEIDNEMPGVDKDGPMAVLLLDPEKYQDPNGFGEPPVVGVFTLKDPKLFQQGAGAGDVEIEVVGKLGLICDWDKPLADVVQYIKDAGIAAVPTGGMTDLLVIDAHAGDLLNRYKMDIQTGLDRLRLQSGGQVEPGAEPPPEAEAPTAEQQMMLKAIDYFAKLIDEVEQQVGHMQLGVSFVRDRFTGKLSIESTPGSDFAEFLEKNDVPANRALAKYLPKEAFMTSIMSYDVASVRDLYVGMTRIVYDILGLSEDETDKVCKALGDAIDATSGVGAGAGIAAEGTASVGLYGINDSETARANVKALFALTKEGAIGDLMNKYGMTMAHTEEHRGHAGVPIDKVEMIIDFDKLSAAMPPTNETQMLVEMWKQMLKTSYGYEDRIVGEMVFGKKLLAATYGAGHAGLMDRQIDLMKSGGKNSIADLPAYRAALERHVKESAAVGHLSLFGYADTIGKTLGDLMSIMGPAGMNLFPTRDELPAHEDFMSMSIRMEENRAVIAADVPIQPIKAFAEAMNKKMQKMQEDMMRNMQPGAPGEPAPVVPPDFNEDF